MNTALLLDRAATAAPGRTAVHHGTRNGNGKVLKTDLRAAFARDTSRPAAAAQPAAETKD